MFKKQPVIKNLAPLRSSDRRKLLDRIASSFDLEQAEVVSSQGAPTATGSPDAGQDALRNTLVPPGVLWAKFSTTTGAEATPVNGVIYAGATDGHVRVLWYALEDALIPTVYSLWKVARLLPLLHTPGLVMAKMQKGADLMAPGLAGPPFPSKATKGALVAVATLTDPAVPLLVGVCEMDIAAIQSLGSSKGNAVRGLTWYGDELWKWQQGGGGSGQTAPKSCDAWLQPYVPETMQQLETSLQDATLSPEEPEKASDHVQSQETMTEEQSASKDHELVEASRTMPISALSTQAIDDAFHRAFLYAASEHRRQSAAWNFPVTQSQFLSEYILPHLTFEHDSDKSTVNIKRTSWKTVKKFIKALEKEGLVSSKERNGECLLLGVDFGHQKITSFTPPHASQSKSTAANEHGGSKTISTTGKPNAPDLRRMAFWRPRQRLKKLVQSNGSDPSGFYSEKQLRQMLEGYAARQKLRHGRFIELDPTLDELLPGRRDGSVPPVDKEDAVVPDDELFKAMLTASDPFWLILEANEVQGTQRPHPGQAPQVHITLDSRAGNKTVTRVWNLEPFRIASAPLAARLQKACATATTVNQHTGSSPKAPIMEIQLQGNKKDAVIKALHDCGVKQAWIDITDKSSQKKK